MADESPKVEFLSDSGIVEIRYFDTAKEQFYRGWKFPETISDELTEWWQKVRRQKNTAFPLKVRTKGCEFAMNTPKYIDINPLDAHGRTDMTGWSLPVVVVDRLAAWREGSPK